jgi:hypothetical protein
LIFQSQQGKPQKRQTEKLQRQTKFDSTRDRLTRSRRQEDLEPDSVFSGSNFDRVYALNFLEVVKTGEIAVLPIF